MGKINLLTQYNPNPFFINIREKPGFNQNRG